MVYMENMALKNPFMRQLTLSGEYIPERKISSKLYGEDLINGKATIYRNQINFNLPVTNWKKNTLSASFTYLNQYFILKNSTNYQSQELIGKMYFNNSSILISPNFTKRATLWQKPVVYNLSLNGNFNPSFSKYELSVAGVILLTMKRTQNTSLSIGTVLNINPNSSIPAFPLITYNHKFNNSNIELFLNLPYRLAVRKELSAKNSISFINKLNGYVSFFNLENQFLIKNTNYSTTEIVSGFLYEHRLSKKIVASLSIGTIYSVNSKMKDDKNTFWDDSYIVENKNTFDPYANIKISLLPFFLGL